MSIIPSDTTTLPPVLTTILSHIFLILALYLPISAGENTFQLLSIEDCLYSNDPFSGGFLLSTKSIIRSKPLCPVKSFAFI